MPDDLPRTLPALSIRQPWAWLIVAGHKDIENRSWQSQYRGPVLIHAGKTPAEGDDLDAALRVCDALKLPEDAEFALGGIVGFAWMTGCVAESKSLWFFGPYGFTLTGAGALPFRAVRGRLGFFPVEVTAEEARAVLAGRPPG